jgi:16S rRNA (guanine527-N7)-methyltransferase
MYTEIIETLFRENGIPVTRRQTGLLSGYLTALSETNRTMNLTAIRDPDEAIRKHLLDCALCVEAIPAGADLIDVGSGAGLPAVPFAILRDDIRVTALDSTGKKAAFIEETASALGLGNLRVRCGRAEELGRRADFRERYTAVSARAVARLPVLAELCLPLLKPGGVFLAMKGRQADEELAEARAGIGTLGGKPRPVVKYFLPGGPGEARGLILIDKTAPTPASFPRTYARIVSKPL